MQKIKRIAVALLAAVIISTNVYGNVITVNASSVVIGGVVGGEALIDYLVALAAIAVCGLCGSQAEQSDIDMLRDELIAFSNTDIGSAALKDYSQKTDFSVIHGGGGCDPGSGGDYQADALLNASVNGLVMGEALNAFMSDFFDYLEDKGTFESLDDGIYYHYDVLPSNVYVGYNSSIVPDAVIAADGYDPGVAHIQVDSVHGYYDIQESGTYVYSSYPSTRRDGYYDCLTYKFLYAPSLGSNAYQLIGGTVSFPSYQVYYPYGSIEYFRGNSFVYSYTSGSLSVAAGNGNTLHKAADSDSIYWSPSATMPICFKSGNNSYRLTTDGLYGGLAPDSLKYNFSSISTAENAQLSMKPLVGKLPDFWRAIGDDLVSAVDPDTGLDLPKVYTKDSLNQIHEEISNYYNETVENYYNDTSYIDQSQYITNITNIYQQSAVDSVPESNPSIDPVPGILTGISDLFVPDIALYESYIANIKAKFAFKDRFFEFGKNIITNLFSLEPEIPKLMMDFGKSESIYNYGGKTYALDMTWYSRYKPQVDDIIVSIAWLCFAYWLIKNLPGIISGTSSLSKLGQASVDKDKD